MLNNNVHGHGLTNAGLKVSRREVKSQERKPGGEEEEEERRLVTSV